MSTEHGRSIEAALGRFLDGEPEPGDGAALAAAMEQDAHFADAVRRLLAVDDLLRQAAELGPAAFVEVLQTRLAAEADGDRFTQVVLDRLPEAAADRAGTLRVPKERGPSDVPRAPRRFRWARVRRVPASAALLLLAFGAAWWLASSPLGFGPRPAAPPEIAWLRNAQNCRWAEEGAPAGDLRPGKLLDLQRGLAELHFHSGVCIVLQGPASLQLVSAGSVRLLRGHLAAKVPESARGFEVLSPGGKVVDLGTEFGVGVEEDGSTQVCVFRGEVEAQAAQGEALASAVVRLKKEQSARIGAKGVLLDPAGLGTDSFVREIIPPPIITPRTLALDFSHAVAGTLPDRDGQGTGLTHRLPGTRHDLRVRDKDLYLNLAMGRLELSAFDNDLDKQRKLYQGEYLGVRLSDLGFTGTEDFAVTIVVPNVPKLGGIGQLGLYAGARSDKNIRGGLLRRWGSKGGYYSQFLVHNNGGRDSRLHTVGLTSSGEDLRLTLQRRGGKYTLTIENLTSDTSSTLSNYHPDFLDGERDLYVGVFAAVPWRKWPNVLFIKEFKATVWTLQSK